jgi:hypothetical protein
MIEATNEACLNRVGALHKNDRNGLGRSFRCERTGSALHYNDHRQLLANQFGDQHRQPIVLT